MRVLAAARDDGIERVADELQERYKVDVTGTPMAISRLREACEAAKKALSVDREARISLPFLATDAQGQPIHDERAITRDELEGMTRDLLERLEPRPGERSGEDGER